MIKKLYDTSLSLLTDLYQLTMAYGYYQSQTAEKEAVFNLYFRRHPFSGGFTVACGLNYVIGYLREYRLSKKDIRYLETLTGNDGKPLFDADFLQYLTQLEFTCDIDAVPSSR